MDSSNWSSRLREHRGTLTIVALGIAAFGFLAHEDRTARHAAGIDDTCAWFQMINQQFPMNRCFSLDEFISMMDRRGGRSDSAPGPDNARYARPEHDAAKGTTACEASAKNSAPSNPDRPQMPDEVAKLLEGSESSADRAHIKTDYVYRLLNAPNSQDMCNGASTELSGSSEPR